jgi:hypothetical protein
LDLDSNPLITLQKQYYLLLNIFTKFPFQLPTKKNSLPFELFSKSAEPQQLYFGSGQNIPDPSTLPLTSYLLYLYSSSAAILVHCHCSELRMSLCVYCLVLSAYCILYHNSVRAFTVQYNRVRYGVVYCLDHRYRTE